MSATVPFENTLSYVTTGFSTLPVYTNQNANQYTPPSMDDLVVAFHRSFASLGTSQKVTDRVFSPPIFNCPNTFTKENFAVTTAEINDHDSAISGMDIDTNADQPSTDNQAQNFQCAPFALNDAEQEQERRTERGCELRELSSDAMETVDTDTYSISDPMDTRDDSDEQLIYHRHFQHIDVDMLLCHPDIYWNGKLATSGYSWQVWKEVRERERMREGK